MIVVGGIELQKKTTHGTAAVPQTGSELEAF